MTDGECGCVSVRVRLSHCERESVHDHHHHPPSPSSLSSPQRKFITVSKRNICEKKIMCTARQHKRARMYLPYERWHSNLSFSLHPHTFFSCSYILHIYLCYNCELIPKKKNRNQNQKINKFFSLILFQQKKATNIFRRRMIYCCTHKHTHTHTQQAYSH